MLPMPLLALVLVSPPHVYLCAVLPPPCPYAPVHRNAAGTADAALVLHNTTTALCNVGLMSW